jgi:hypothetical protein
VSISHSGVSAQPSPIQTFIDGWVAAKGNRQHALLDYPVPSEAWAAFRSVCGDPPREDDPVVARYDATQGRVRNTRIAEIHDPRFPACSQMLAWFEVELMEAAVLEGSITWWGYEVRGRVLDLARHQARHLVILLATGWSSAPPLVRRLDHRYVLTTIPPPPVPAAWRTETVLALARGIVAADASDRMLVLADALEEAGCDDHEWLALVRDDKWPWFSGAGVLRSLA